MYPPRVLLWCLLLAGISSQAMAQSAHLKPLRNHKLRHHIRQQAPAAQAVTSELPAKPEPKPDMLIRKRQKNRKGPRLSSPKRESTRTWYRRIRASRKGRTPNSRKKQDASG